MAKTQIRMELSGPMDRERPAAYSREPKTGIQVCMYIDEPGRFFTVSGQAVDNATASRAGYDVVGLRKERLLAEKMVQAEQDIREELDMTRAAIESEVEAEVEAETSLLADHESLITSRTANQVPMETEAYATQHKGGGKWVVISKFDRKELIDRGDRDVAIDYMIRAAISDVALGGDGSEDTSPAAA